MKEFKFPKILDMSLIELVTFQLEYVLMDHDVTDAEIKIFAYIYIYGPDALAHIIKDKVLAKKTAENYISNLRRLGLVHGSRNATKAHPSIRVFKEDIEFSIKLKLKDDING